MIDTSIEAQLAGDESALFSAVCTENQILQYW
jgi:hypothetical protein